VTLDYKGSRLTGIEAVPVRTIGKIQVVPQKGDEAKPILEREKIYVIGLIQTAL